MDARVVDEPVRSSPALLGNLRDCSAHDRVGSVTSHAPVDESRRDSTRSAPRPRGRLAERDRQATVLTVLRPEPSAMAAPMPRLAPVTTMHVIRCHESLILELGRLRFSTNACMPSSASRGAVGQRGRSASMRRPSCSARPAPAARLRARTAAPAGRGRRTRGELAWPPRARAARQAIDQADGKRLVGSDRAAGHDHLERPRLTDQPRQALRAAVAGIRPSLTSGRPNLAFGGARRNVQASASSQPPPNA